MSESPDPMIDVLMETMLFENRETAALLLCRLDEAGYKLKSQNEPIPDNLFVKEAGYVTQKIWQEKSEQDRVALGKPWLIGFMEGYISGRVVQHQL
mgnify:CR=1 FL=1